MRIEVSGDDSIGRQARSYAEYRLFAALSQVIDTNRVKRASLELRRARARRACDLVLCTVTIQLDGPAVARIKASGAHPYAAINRTMDRVRRRSWPLPHNSLAAQAVGVE